MIPRALTETLLRCAATFPVVTLTGPRQSGKTTLCRAAFPDLAYATPVAAVGSVATGVWTGATSGAPRARANARPAAGGTVSS